MTSFSNVEVLISRASTGEQGLIQLAKQLEEDPQSRFFVAIKDGSGQWSSLYTGEKTTCEELNYAGDVLKSRVW